MQTPINNTLHSICKQQDIQQSTPKTCSMIHEATIPILLMYKL